MWLKSYLLKGIQDGFDIVDQIDLIQPYDRCNSSVYKGEAGKFVDNLHKVELEEER